MTRLAPTTAWATNRARFLAEKGMVDPKREDMVDWLARCLEAAFNEGAAGRVPHDAPTAAPQEETKRP